MDTTNSVNFFLEAAREFEKFLIPKRGYDKADFCDLKVSSTGIVSYCFHIEDQFQINLPYSQIFWSGYKTITRLDLADIPTREERELTVLLRQQGESTAIADSLTSATAMRYAKEIVAQRESHAALVHPSNFRE